MIRKAFHVEGLDIDLYDGDVVDLYEYDGHFILRYGWAKLKGKPYKGWHFRSLSDTSLVVQAASVNLSLVKLHARNNRPADQLDVVHLLHS